jgi:hypothetical protein
VSTTQTLISLAAVRALRAEQQARASGDQALRESQLTREELATAIDASLQALIERDPTRFEGKAGRAPTAAEIAEATAAFLEPRLVELRGEDGSAPTRAELIALIEAVILDNPERFRGPKGEAGKPGRGIASVRIDMAGDLIVSYTDGSSTNVGRVVGRDGEAGKGGERLVVLGGGASEGTPTDRVVYTRPLSGFVVVVPPAEHGIATPVTASVRNGAGVVVMLSVAIDADGTVTLTSLRPLDGHSLTLE